MQSSSMADPSRVLSDAQPQRIVRLGFKWFKISSPDDGVGLELRGYRLLNTYDADRQKGAYAEDRVVQIDVEKGRENSPVLKTKVP